MSTVVVLLLTLPILLIEANAKNPPKQCSVTVAATTPNAKGSRYANGWIYLHSSWGEQVNIFCSSNDTASLTLYEREEKLYTRQLNSTTIELTRKEHMAEYEYHCRDSKTRCVDSLTVYVEPLMTVVSPRVHEVRRDDGSRSYFVPRGEDYHVQCSGNERGLLQIKAGTRIVETINVNEVTVMYNMQTHRRGDRTYWCSAGRLTSQWVRVTVDYYPEGQNFQCTLFSWNKLECSWRSSSVVNTFKLFYTDSENKNSKFLCADNSGYKKGSCVWKNRFRQAFMITADQNFFLTLETCNDVFCDNQTFRMYSNSITKLDSVADFKALNTSSLGAVLTWRDPVPSHWTRSYTCVYRVEYRLVAFGEDWRRVNTSSVQCVLSDCKFPLGLPFPDSEYEARVHVRFTEATEERMWSEPASKSIFTKPSSMECACSELSRQPLSEVACEMCELRNHFVKGDLALNNRKIALKQKLANLKRYAKLVDDIHSLSST